MAKRVKQTSKGVQEKLSNVRDNYLKDRISELPDEILVSIISNLRLMQALRTGVLSKRWQFIWKFTFGSLDLVHLDFMPKRGERKKKNPEPELGKYVEWVNQVLELHQSSTINEFRVCFGLDASYKCIIDKWMEFATAKRAQFIELDLNMFLFSKAPEKYSLSQECYANIQSPCGLSSNKSLRSITLKSVNVKGKILEFVLSSCPLLERLHVERSDHLVSLQVAGSSLALKYLEINYCAYLKNINISAPKLMSFNYCGRYFLLNIQRAPMLVDVSISEHYQEPIYDYNGLASYLSQLQTLRLDFSRTKQIPQCELTNLRHLTMTIRAKDSNSLLEVSSIIKASPFLHRFTLKVPWQGCNIWKRPVQTAPNGTHQHLKIVEYDEFVGRPIDFDLVIYLLEKAVTLEKCVIKPSYRYPRKGWPKRVAFMEEATKELQKEVPQGVKLIVL